MQRTAPAQISIGSRGRHRFLDFGFAATIFLWLLFACNAILPSVMTNGGTIDFDDRSKAIVQNISTMFLGISIVFLVLYIRELILLLARNKVLVLLVIVAWLSYLWSNDPATTLRRCILLTSFLIIACITVLKLDLRQVVKLLLYLSFFGVLSSIIFLIALPELGFNNDGRGARGAFLHKNIFSVFLVVSLIAIGNAIRMQLIPKLYGYGFFTISAALLLLSNSATAWAAALIMLGVYVLIRMRRLPFQYYAMMMAFAAALLLFLIPATIANLDTLFAGLDRDPTLTGRNHVWAYTLRMIEDRLLLGYGYAAFWESEPFYSYVRQTLNWNITHAHNGYLEVWLELGLVGLALTIIYFAGCIIRLFLFRPSPDVVAFVLPTLIGLLAYNLAETQLLIAKDLGWSILLVCALMTTPGLDQIRARYPKLL